jgi:hypothetical protein
MSLTFNEKIFEDIEKERKEWQKKVEEVFAAQPERLKRFATVSDREINRIYTPVEVKRSGFPVSILLPEACSRPCTGAGYGPCGCLRAWDLPETPTNAFTCW